MMNVSRRLTRIAAHVVSGQIAADIGADHALLSVFLVRNGICPKVIIGELNEGPWRRAQAYVKKEGLHNVIDVRRGDGLQVLAPGEVTTVVIAGLGGKVIADIIMGSLTKAYSYARYVLQPQPPLYPLRKVLTDLGWEIVEEEIVEEKENFYTIVVTEPRQKPAYRLSELELEFGPVVLRKAERPENQEFLRRELRRWERMVESLRASQSSEARGRLSHYLLLKRELEEILDAGYR
ncbi:MAG TPA: SAM-dependent methyltransferase [Syntrophothermus lipocalidus]|nr:SAM-dependent methyltransferase [Syntrophothermus lipocalidus]